jgi:HSP90 family molecular chaperone
MAYETRVNLRRLLHDIRDAYPAPIEEVIITELIANALDSGATRIEFIVDPNAHMMRCVDNGTGMRRMELKEYHDIAATTKTRGRGIGFAGIGAKLSLLVADHVITETRGHNGSRGATQ